MRYRSHLLDEAEEVKHKVTPSLPSLNVRVSIEDNVLVLDVDVPDEATTISVDVFNPYTLRFETLLYQDVAGKDRVRISIPRDMLHGYWFIVIGGGYLYLHVCAMKDHAPLSGVYIELSTSTRYPPGTPPSIKIISRSEMDRSIAYIRSQLHPTIRPSTYMLIMVAIAAIVILSLLHQRT